MTAVDQRSVTDERRSEPRLTWWHEVVIALGFYFAYSMVRNRFGAGPESKDIAFRHARGVIKVERWIGGWFEPKLQRWYLDLPHDGFIRLWNIFYGTAHFVVTIGVLVFAFRRAPRVYRWARTTLAVTTGIALFGFAAYTLMPPRLLDSNSIYGACRGQAANCHGYGIVDTIESWGGIWKFGSGGMANVSNQYAAMPSMHFGWSTWCAITVVLVIGKGRLRWLAFLYPAATLFCILVTGNHFWLDALFGALALGTGAGVTTLALRAIGPRLANRSDRSSTDSSSTDSSSTDSSSTDSSSIASSSTASSSTDSSRTGGSAAGGSATAGSAS